MSLRSCITSAFIFVLAGHLFAGESPKKGTSPTSDVGTLVRQLGSDKYAEREAATASLDALGAIAIEHLKKARHSTDPEVQRRVQHLLTCIQSRVESARLIQPRRIRLVYTNMPLTQVVEDFGRRTGVTINLTGDQQKNEKRMITLDTGDVTFWEAMDQLCQKAGLIENEPSAMPDGQNNEGLWERRMMFRRGWIDYNYQPMIQQGPLTLQDGKGKPMPTYHAGAIRVRALPPGFPKNAPKVTAGEDEVVINIEITPEPRLGWQGLRGLRIERVLNEKEQELDTPLPYITEDGPAYDERFGGFSRSYYGNQDNGSGSKFVSMRIKKPKDKSKTLKLVQGKLAAEVLSPLEPLIGVDNLLQSVGEAFPGEHGGSVKIVEAAKGEGETFKLRVVVESPPRNNNGQMIFGGGVIFQPQMQSGDGEGNDNYLAQIDRELTVLDSKGRHLKLIEANTNDQENVTNPTKEYHLTYDLPAGSPKPSKLVYFGQRVVIVETSFTLKDVPLP
jgi:hypothetical protein